MTFPGEQINIFHRVKILQSLDLYLGLKVRLNLTVLHFMKYIQAEGRTGVFSVSMKLTRLNGAEQKAHRFRLPSESAFHSALTIAQRASPDGRQGLKDLCAVLVLVKARVSVLCAPQGILYSFSMCLCFYENIQKHAIARCLVT